MKKFLKIFLGVLFAALLLGTFWFLWQKTRPVKVVYTIVQPKLDTLKQYVVATGKVEPRDEVLIKPQISGIVSDVYKEAGQMVRKGEVIATVKVVPEMGQLSSAESRVSVAEISLDQTRREFNRTEALHKKGVVSDEEYEQGRTALRKAQEELQNAKENMEIVKNGITSRYKELSNTQIRSTIDGMILDVPVKVGNSVIQSNTFNDGTTIATVADMSNMLFRGNVDETDVGKLHETMPVKLTIGALQNVELDALLEYVSPKATEDNGVIMFEVKAAVKIPENVFVRAGYSANASIVIQSREGVLTLPESTVEFEGDKTYVYLLTSADGAEEQTFDKHEVKIGLSDGINIELTEGVTAESLARLKPCFVTDGTGTVTAANSSSLNDAAAAVVIMTRAKAEELGCTPMVCIRDFAVAGYEASLMGYSPYFSSKKLAEKLDIDLTDIDFFEINEAFASQAFAVSRDLGLDPEKVNIYGGGISIGHPIGATGTILAIKCAYELAQRHPEKQDAMVSMCIGGGQGISMYFTKE